MLGVRLLTNRLMTGEEPKGMYGHYEKTLSAAKYEDDHLDLCLNLMSKYDLHDKLGLSLDTLLDMDPDSIKKIEDHMIKYTRRANEVLNDLNNKPNKGHKHAVTGKNNTKR